MQHENRETKRRRFVVVEDGTPADEVLARHACA